MAIERFKLKNLAAFLNFLQLKLNCDWNVKYEMFYTNLKIPDLVCELELFLFKNLNLNIIKIHWYYIVAVLYDKIVLSIFVAEYNPSIILRSIQ